MSSSFWRIDELSAVSFSLSATQTSPEYRYRAARKGKRENGDRGTRLLGVCPRTVLLRAAILSLRAECSPNRSCDVGLLRLRAVCLRSRSRVGLAALATDITRTAS